MDSASLRDLQRAVIEFRDQRDWQRFHQPRHLAAALQIECAELQEQLLWLSDAEVEEKLRDPRGRVAIEDEMADILAYLLCLAEQTGTDLGQALQRKLIKNQAKYPISQAFGRADKYTAYHTKSKNNRKNIKTQSNKPNTEEQPDHNLNNNP